MNECECNNIGFINNEWLCLECGEQTEQNKNMDDKKVIEKIKDWLKSNLEGGDIDQINIEEDNKNLLNAIEEWQKK